MIRLNSSTRSGPGPILLDPAGIVSLRWDERNHDTVLAHVSGLTYRVRETPERVLNLGNDWRRRHLLLNDAEAAGNVAYVYRDTNGHTQFSFFNEGEGMPLNEEPTPGDIADSIEARDGWACDVGGNIRVPVSHGFRGALPGDPREHLLAMSAAPGDPREHLLAMSAAPRPRR